MESKKPQQQLIHGWIEISREISKTKKFYKKGTAPTEYEKGYLAGLEKALEIMTGKE